MIKVDKCSIHSFLDAHPQKHVWWGRVKTVWLIYPFKLSERQYYSTFSHSLPWCRGSPRSPAWEWLSHVCDTHAVHTRHWVSVAPPLSSELVCCGHVQCVSAVVVGLWESRSRSAAAGVDQCLHKPLSPVTHCQILPQPTGYDIQTSVQLKNK